MTFSLQMAFIYRTDAPKIVYNEDEPLHLRPIFWFTKQSQDPVVGRNHSVLYLLKMTDILLLSVYLSLQ